MSSKYVCQIWQADLTRPLKLVALALADTADALGIVPLSDPRMIAWLTGYSLEELDKILDKLYEAKVLVQLPEQRIRIADENIQPMAPYWKQSKMENDPETEKTVRFQLESLMIQTETAQKLVQSHPSQVIQEWIEIYQNAVAVGLAQDCGWLISALKRGWDKNNVLDRIEKRRQNQSVLSLADALPDELIDLLEKMKWADVLDEVVEAYQEDPQRVLAWAKYTVKDGWGAGKFRNGLRSRLNPPVYEPVMRPPNCILDDEELEIVDQENVPEEVYSLWDQCLFRISDMPEAERGFSNGQLASWLLSAKPDSMKCTGLDTRFCLKSENSFAANWIETNARGLIEDILEELSGMQISLESVS